MTDDRKDYAIAFEILAECFRANPIAVTKILQQAATQYPLAMSTVLRILNDFNNQAPVSSCKHLSCYGQERCLDVNSDL